MKIRLTRFFVSLLCDVFFASVVLQFAENETVRSGAKAHMLSVKLNDGIARIDSVDADGTEVCGGRVGKQTVAVAVMDIKGRYVECRGCQFEASHALVGFSVVTFLRTDAEQIQLETPINAVFAAVFFYGVGTRCIAVGACIDFLQVPHAVNRAVVAHLAARGGQAGGEEGENEYGDNVFHYFFCFVGGCMFLSGVVRCETDVRSDMVRRLFYKYTTFADGELEACVVADERTVVKSKSTCHFPAFRIDVPQMVGRKRGFCHKAVRRDGRIEWFCIGAEATLVRVEYAILHGRRRVAGEPDVVGFEAIVGKC